jgi:hypothetical protein
MAAPHDATRRHPIAFSRARDARVLRLLEEHPATAAMLVGLGWFPTKGKALKRLRRLVARGKVRLVGTVCRKPGRPEHVYCRWRPKPDQLLHEVDLTQVCLRLHAGRVLRGPQLEGSDLRPDAELEINGDTYFLELDRGSMGYRQVRGRMRQYEGSDRLVLWVCPTEGQRDGRRRLAAEAGHRGLFTTFAEAVADPHRPIWVDGRGERAALPRHRPAGPGVPPGPASIADRPNAPLFLLPGNPDESIQGRLLPGSQNLEQVGLGPVGDVGVERIAGQPIEGDSHGR